MRILPAPGPAGHAWREVFPAFLALGLRSFGGPLAHLGFFREELVERRRWLHEARFAELLALCQLLPGPASSQLGLAIGRERAGLAGALAAFLGFTLPSALLMLLAGLGVAWLPAGAAGGAVHAMAIVALAVVARACWQMALTLCPGARERVAALLAAALALLLAGAGPFAGLLPAGAGGAAWSGPVVVGLAFAIGLALARPADAAAARAPVDAPATGRAWPWALACALGLALALLVPLLDAPPLAALAAACWRAGALVFGGGHVVLPLLHDGASAAGLDGREAVLTGYGLAQALPGPLFAFAGFLGARVDGVLGGLVALAAVFAPGLALVLAAQPAWARLRRHARVLAALGLVHAAVVGLMLAALVDPVAPTALRHPLDGAAALLALLALRRWPAWAVVLGAAALGLALPALAAAAAAAAAAG